MIVAIPLAVIGVIAVILRLAGSKPDSFVVQRTVTAKAAPGKVFPWINDFRKWGGWSPYEKLDPHMKKTFQGAESGRGAVYTWEGNRKAGAGRMEIVESSMPGNVTIKLDFTRPFEGHNICEFTIRPQGDSTEITWSMRGPSPFLSKVMHVFVSMDKLVGKEFETGLANLKAVAEK